MNLLQLSDFLIHQQQKGVMKEKNCLAQTDLIQVFQLAELKRPLIRENSKPSIIYQYTGHEKIKIGQNDCFLSGGNLLYVAENSSITFFPLKKGAIIVQMALETTESLPQLLKKLQPTLLSTQTFMSQMIEQLDQQGYLFFDSKKTDDPAYIMERILCDYFDSVEFAGKTILAKYDLLVIELLRGRFAILSEEHFSKNHYTLDDLMEYIEIHYQTTTLEKMAAFFNYNSNYLSNFLKKETGKSFMELLQIKKMTVALELLGNPQITIEEIVDYIGYSSTSFFYKKFKSYFGISPAKMRQFL